jgi:UDP-2,3-diacylglucosamine pyrophosphatase LpxH
MAKRYAAVLSDLHIGDNSPTNWYQAKVHEPRLVTLLSWIAGHADDVQELILLGDLADIWTYPPDVRPPTMAEIIAANPRTLGPGGALAQAAKALDGNVTLVLGNHDGQLTPQDLQDLNQAVGYELNFVADGIHTLTGGTGARTTFAHGHFWTMFNAPDPTVPAAWNTMPIGHFVTRAFAYYLTTILKPGQTAADLAGMGSPNGFDLSDFLGSLIELPDGVAALLLDYVADAAGLDKNTKIVLPGGTTVTYGDAYKVYDNLATRWVDAWDDRLIAYRAACSDQWGVYLGWFAQALAIQTASDLVLFGHTHQPVAGLTVSPVNAINSGYECVAIPDVPGHEFTFTMVDLETPSGQLFYLDPTGGGPQPFGAPFQPPVAALPGLPLTLDASCYLTIFNATGAPLVRDGSPSPTTGRWVVEPPEQIPAGGVGMMWLQNDYELPGSDTGTFTYNDGRLEFWARCLPLANGCTGPAGGTFTTRAGSSGWSRAGVVAQGHPLQVRYTVR